VVTLVAALAFAASPFVFGGFRGFGPDRFPMPQVDPPVQPAGYAFGIWGLIYLWLLVHASTGLTRGRRRQPVWDATRTPLGLSLLVGSAWIPVAKASPLWGTVLIFVMLGGALIALIRGRAGDPWLLQGPIGLYAGWLTAASLVALGITGAGYGLGPGALGWAWIAILAALGVSSAVQWASGAPFYGVAVAWALGGIAVQNWGSQWGLVAIAALGAAAVLAQAAWSREGPFDAGGDERSGE
jgi:hypothetical protein